EPEIRTIAKIIPMADRTMEELLQALTEGDVPNDAIKLMLFPYSLEDRARICYEKEPPNSIITLDDLVNKFGNQFFPPSKTTHLKNEISRFTQRFDETFSEALDHFKELLRACPHHGFSKLTQIDTFYNGLTKQDQDSLNAASGGNLLNKTTREALQIIENKSKVCYSRSKSNVSRVNTNSRDVVTKTDDRIDQLVDQISNLVEIVNKQVIAPANAVKRTCVTCGGAHAYYEYIDTDSNPSSVCAATGSYNQVSRQNRASHQIPPPGFASVQNNSNRFNQEQPSTSGTLSSNTIPNPKGEMKAVTTRSGLAYEGPSIPTESSLEIVDEQNTKEILDKEHSNSSEVPLKSNLCFADALLLMPKFASTIKSLPTNKDKLFELAKVPLNENCLAMLLKKLPEKLEDPGKFLIPCDFPGINEKSPIEEHKYSFSIGYEHFITTPVTELDKVVESSDKNLVPIPREHEVTSDNESEYNEPINDDFSSAFTTFTNLLFNDKDDFTIHDEDVPIKEFKVYSNPLFDNDEINSDELESHCLNVESNFVETLSNHDTLKFDHLDEFSGALMPIHVAEEERIRKEHAEYISLMERLITINPCPLLTVNANTIVESLPSSLIPVQDNDSQREEIDIVTDMDELLPPGFENDDSKGEIYVLEDLRVDTSISNSENELVDVNQDDPLFPRPPPEPPDAEFDFEPYAGEEISVVMNDNDKFKCLNPGEEFDISTNEKDDNCFSFTLVIHIFLLCLICPEVFLLLLSAKSEDTIFNPGFTPH
nr:reverse transcriptase domain-containing protein [Tanacetum cinerariifolium]